MEQIGACGHAELTRLTVLKRWFERPERLAAFAIWVATRAVSRKGKARGPAGKLFREARSLLADVDLHAPSVDRGAAEQLYDRLRAFQNEYQRQRWGPVRIIRNWDLLLVEQALEIHLWHQDSPAYGYKLAANYCEHFDSRYGPGLSGPSRARIREIVAFMLDIEASETR
ncbi:MAG: hypothetical protein FJ279_13945 [Planctomycetes bacterium]|nr:hypothetical protein [Planctomycetota bacterium]MBM4081013.1 hypothetical protein [Planctomycetota bacterium]